MTSFFLSILVFLLAHVVPPAPPVRNRLIALFGRRAYLIGYSFLSTVLLGWIIVSARSAPVVYLWYPAPWQALVPVVAMPFAFWLVAAGLAVDNPASVTLRRSNGRQGTIVAITRHPVLWGFLIWALAHVPPNGDLVSLILFGAMALLALSGMAVLDRRARRRLGEAAWQTVLAETSVFPFAALIAGRARFRPDRTFIVWSLAGFAAYFWFLFQGHRMLIGVDPLAWF